MEPSDYLTQEIVRLLGEVRGKRTLELGLARGCISHSLAARGASPILVEESPDAIAQIRNSELFKEFKFEVRQSKLADLAFCQAESIDIAFSIISLTGTADLARLFRQLQRVLRVQGIFVFGLVHPLAFIKYRQESSPEQVRYRSRDLIDKTTLTCHFPVALPDRVRQVSFGEVFSLLKRAGLNVDQMCEIPEESKHGRDTDPTMLVIRARK